MKSKSVVAALFAFMLMSVPTAPAQACEAGQEDTITTRELHQLFADEWEYGLRENPLQASSMGHRRWNDKWGDQSLAAIERRHQHDRETLARLKKIDRKQLSPRDQVNYDMFQRELEMDIEGHQYQVWLMPVSMRGGIQTAADFATNLRFTTAKDYEDWIARMRAFPALAEQVTALMRQGIKEKMVQPRVLMERVPAQIDEQIVTDPAQSQFYKPFQEMPKEIPAAEQQRLQQAAQQAIREQIVPAYQKFKKFFVEEYLPASYPQVGAWQYPRGQELYAFRARMFTTTDMTPDQIHEIGLKEVARIRAEMEKIRAQVGFQGTLKEFFDHLRTDPKYFYKTGDELLQAYRAMSKEIDPNLVKVFKTLPRSPYGVVPIPMNIAPDTTTAYYNQPAADGSRAGRYFVNLYKPESRPKWEMMALSLHEAVPGHHLQIALAQEQGEIPNFRRYGGVTAFVEGWGLYAESLGEDMGLYKDPYAKFGQLTYEMWRAVRLVVDTGMHAKKWTRQQAIDYFMDNAAKTELDITNEIDRYIGWPGQALAYKIGELKFKELRARASKELGDKFDVREFHDAALSQGAVPLNVLENMITAWIAEKKAGAAKAGVN
jgi:uncharacterized protein (DUF885 family)